MSESEWRPAATRFIAFASTFPFFLISELQYIYAMDFQHQTVVLPSVMKGYVYAALYEGAWYRIMVQDVFMTENKVISDGCNCGSAIHCHLPFIHSILYFGFWFQVFVIFNQSSEQAINLSIRYSFNQSHVNHITSFNQSVN